MHLLYLDDSGSVKNAADRHIVLAGISVPERQTHWLGLELDKLAAQLWPADPSALEFHGTEIYAGKKHWRGIGRADRHDAYCKALDLLNRNHLVRLFGAAIHKDAAALDDPMELAFEQVASRFDQMLGRLHKANDTQRGIIILDKSSYETSLQKLAVQFRHDGHKWGQLRNLSEVPLFVDSKATRMIQLADLVAHSMRRYFELGDSTYFDRISQSFDSEGGVVHGIIHQIPVGSECNCLSCRKRPRRTMAAGAV